MGGKANMRAHQALRSGYPQTQVTRLLSPTPREKAVAETVGWLVFSIPVLGCSGFNEIQINTNTIFYSVLPFCVVSPSQLLQEAWKWKTFSSLNAPHF